MVIITNINKIIEENEFIEKYDDVLENKNKNNNKILVQKGIKQSQRQTQGSQPEILESKKEKNGFFSRNIGI